MDDNYARLVDDLPPRFPPGRERRADVRAIRTTVAALPLANPAQAAEALGQLLEGMLATKWSGADRIAALDVVRGPATGLANGIERQIGGESHPLPPAKLQLVGLAEGFHHKLAQAYALALHELCAPSGRLPRFRSKVAATAVVRALAHQDLVLQWAYRQYQSPPAGVWRLVHALYGFACEIGVADSVIEDPLPDGVPLDARDAYTHILLLALSNPYRFSVRELQEAREITRCLTRHCVLARAGAGGIGVDTESDAGPGYIQEDRIEAGAGVLSLDAAPLERFLDEHTALLPPGIEYMSFRRRGAPTVEASVALVARLRSGWKTSASRGFERLGAGHALDVAIGMHALHFVLAGNVDFAAFMSTVHGNAIMLSAREHAPSWIAGTDTGQAQLFSAEVLDQSAGGYRLCMHAADGPRIRVGEVIGLAPSADEDEEKEWMAGLIRWMRSDDDEVFVGVELLSRRARAAGLRPVGENGESHAPQRAVALDDGNGDAGPAFSLLVPDLFDRNAACIEVALPADPANWRSRPGVIRCRLQEAGPISGSYFLVKLAPETGHESSRDDGIAPAPDASTGELE